jgi:hypothetical protein
MTEAHTAYNNQLRALLTKRAEQVDYHLNNIFLTLAAPLHLNCHNSSSYKNKQTGVNLKRLL